LVWITEWSYGQLGLEHSIRDTWAPERVAMVGELQRGQRTGEAVEANREVWGVAIRDWAGGFGGSGGLGFRRLAFHPQARLVHSQAMSLFSK